MERLTYKSSVAPMCFIDHIRGNVKEPHELNAQEICVALNKLAEYEDAEEQGKFLKIPIDENTPVYSIEYCCGENPDYKVGMCHRSFCKDCNKKSYYIKNGIAKQCTLSEIGKSVFFTQEQADDALEKIKNS